MAGQSRTRDTDLVTEIRNLRARVDELERVTAARYGSLMTATGAWVDYSATNPVTGVTVGNGSLVARYKRNVDRSIDFTIQFLLGSTSAVTGAINVATPITAYGVHLGNFSAYATIGGTPYPLLPVWNSSTTLVLWAHNATGTYATGTATGAAIPAAWVAGSFFSFGGRLEASAS